MGGPRQRALLRRLLLSANAVVSVERLIDAHWEERPPQHARDEALEVFERNSYGEGAAYASIGLAALAAELGEQGDAALVLGAGDEHLRLAGAVLESTERPLRTLTLERLTREPGAAALETQLAESGSLPLGEAVRTARRLAALLTEARSTGE